MRDHTIARRTLLALAGLSASGVLAEAARRKAPARKSPVSQRPAIAIDAGHGGIDPGATSPHGIREKTITLATARELAGLLAATKRYRPILTRRSDVYVPLRQRVVRARAARAALFVSIHADALPDSGLRGLSVYTLSDQASDRETAALADRENRDDFVAGLHLRRQPHEIGAILLDLVRRQTNNLSLALARDIVTVLGRDVTLLEKPQRAAGFAVLTAPDVPSVLVELGCLSNPIEERLLAKPAYQRELARGLLHSIDDFFAKAVPG